MAYVRLINADQFLLMMIVIANSTNSQMNKYRNEIITNDVLIRKCMEGNKWSAPLLLYLELEIRLVDIACGVVLSSGIRGHTYGQTKDVNYGPNNVLATF